MASLSIPQPIPVTFTGDEASYIHRRIEKAMHLLDVLALADLENVHTRGINLIADAALVHLIEVVDSLKKGEKEQSHG